MNRNIRVTILLSPMFKSLIYLLTVLARREVERIIKEAKREGAHVYIIVPPSRPRENSKENSKKNSKENSEYHFDIQYEEESQVGSIGEVDTTIEGLIKKKWNIDEKNAGGEPLEIPQNTDKSNEEEENDRLNFWDEETIPLLDHFEIDEEEAPKPTNESSERVLKIRKLDPQEKSAINH